MRTATTLVTLSLSLAFLIGCQANLPKAPIEEPKATTSQPTTNEHPDPTNMDCAAISDPAKAEDCGLWKSVEAARKKHNSDNVVKHSPASIQQP